MLLVEKYRPTELKDVAGLNLHDIVIDEKLPHLLLYGPPGTGKTTLAKIIIKKLGADHIVLNASDERGIETIRQKVKVFAGTQSSNGNAKIIFLDESDYLTNEAQTSLRNIMETYSTNCRFVLTANYINKVIDPIQSRCIKIEFNNIPKDAIVARLKYICEQENIPFEEEALVEIAERNGTDMRRSVNKLEELRKGVMLSKLTKESHLANDVLIALEMGEFEMARQKYLDARPEPEQFLKELYDAILNGSQDDVFKRKAIIEIADTLRWIPSVAWKEIQVESLFLRLMELHA